MRKIFPVALAAALAAGALVQAPAAAQFSVGISVNLAPPALPVYDQPPIPGPDYMWVPGYWAWDNYDQDYFWVPGTWMLAPHPGLLWTPAWWGWEGGSYVFHDGYWGAHVGFYGGVSYGFGYSGSGYQGAYWSGGHVFYNQSVTNVTNVHITNVYNKTVIVNNVSHVSYNGGAGGIQARPSPMEQAAMHEQHIAPTSLQQQHIQAAQSNRQLFASANHGRPAIAATARPGMFNGPGIVPTRQAVAYHPQANSQRPGGASPAGEQRFSGQRPWGGGSPDRNGWGGGQQHAPAQQAAPAFHQQMPPPRPAMQAHYQAPPRQYQPAPQQFHPQGGGHPRQAPSHHDERHH